MTELKKLSRKKVTRDRMLCVAERLMAEKGIDGVSMRQISAEIGGNTAALQYHFGDKETLVKEIISNRLALMEPERQRLLDKAIADGRQGDVRTLLEVIHRPQADATDEGGRHVYAAFMLQFVTRIQHEAGFAHPGWAIDGAAIRARHALHAIRPKLTDMQLNSRLAWVAHLFRGALVQRDNLKMQQEPPQSEAEFLDDILNMMAAAFNSLLPHETV